jgi:hypothetical protein
MGCNDPGNALDPHSARAGGVSEDAAMVSQAMQNFDDLRFEAAAAIGGRQEPMRTSTAASSAGPAAADPHSVWVPNTSTHTIRRRIQHQASAGASVGPLMPGIQASACGFQAAGFAILPSAGSTKDATRPAAVCADSDSAAGTPSAVAG